MIQRIQTLYMLAVTALMCVVIFVPMARFTSPDGDFAIMSYGMRTFAADDFGPSSQTAVSWWSVCSVTLLGVCSLLPFVTVFLYKKRLVQIRLLAAESVLLFCTLFFTAYYLWTSFMELSLLSTDNYLTYTLLLVIVAFAFTIMALRAVGRDEALVRSLDRIR